MHAYMHVCMWIYVSMDVFMNSCMPMCTCVCVNTYYMHTYMSMSAYMGWLVGDRSFEGDGVV